MALMDQLARLGRMARQHQLGRWGHLGQMARQNQRRLVLMALLGQMVQTARLRLLDLLGRRLGRLGLSVRQDLERPAAPLQPRGLSA